MTVYPGAMKGTPYTPPKGVVSPVSRVTAPTPQPTNVGRPFMSGNILLKAFDIISPLGTALPSFLQGVHRKGMEQLQAGQKATLSAGIKAGIQNIIPGIKKRTWPSTYLQEEFPKSKIATNPLVGLAADILTPMLPAAKIISAPGKVGKALGLVGKTTEELETGVTNLVKAGKMSSALTKSLGKLEKAGPAVEGIEPILTKEKYAGSINLNKLNISKEAKGTINAVVKIINPGKEPITYEQIADAAQKSSILRKFVSRQDALDFTGQLNKLRETVAAEAKVGKLTQDFLTNVKNLGSQAKKWATTGHALNIGVDPGMITMKEQIVKELTDLGIETDKILKAAEGVDFNDAKQATAFFRKFVKPTMGQVLTEYRYINLLSSPRTHIINAFTNLMQGGILSPATKLVSGGIDWIGSKLTGNAATHYVSEVPAYYRGALNAIGDAVKATSDALAGRTQMFRPDIARMGTAGEAAQAYMKPVAKFSQKFGIIPRALDAMDVFFRTLIQSGEKEALIEKYTKMGEKIDMAKIDKLAGEKAAYWIFRKTADVANKTGQGKILSVIDDFTQAMYLLRGRKYVGPVMSWVVPFVLTPMNILKQMIEFSPAGLATVWGATDKSEQLAKALIGSSVFAGSSWLVNSTDSTWSAPTAKGEKATFYASRQPYSIKIGDNWYDYSRLGPLSFPIALAAAIKYRTQEDPKSLTDSRVKQWIRVFGEMGKYYSDQSYIEAVGELVSAFQNPATEGASFFANFPSQLVPLASLQRWVTQVVDPIYRRPNGVVESIEAAVPFLSQYVTPYITPANEPSKRPYPFLNAISPVKIFPVVPGFEQQFQGEQLTKKYGSLTPALNKIRQQMNDISVLPSSVMSEEQKAAELADLEKQMNDLIKRYTERIKANLNPVR
jgi:hypothetical protein